MDGVLNVGTKHIMDNRGQFRKIYQKGLSAASSFTEISEIFVTKSLAGTIRGMHLLTPPRGNHRLISVLSGEVYDVLLDLRKESSTYMKISTQTLTSLDESAILVPPGVAHGFQALSDCEMLYISSEVWHPDYDKGVSPLSLGIDWPLSKKIISTRDVELPPLLDWTGDF